MGHRFQQFNEIVQNTCLPWTQSRIPTAYRQLWLSCWQHSTIGRCVQLFERFVLHTKKQNSFENQLNWLVCFRLYGFQFASSCWFTIITRFLGRFSIPCLPFNAIYSTSEQTIVYTRARCVSWTVGTCATVCRSSICTIFARNRIGFIRSSRWLHWTFSYGKFENSC